MVARVHVVGVGGGTFFFFNFLAFVMHAIFDPNFSISFYSLVWFPPPLFLVSF
jgi:hypothetical protein